MPDDLPAILLDLAAGLPRASAEARKGHVTLTVGKKVFAFTKGEGLVLKLPGERIEALRTKGKADYLVMGKRKMKEWAYLERKRPADFRKETALLAEALAFVAGT